MATGVGPGEAVQLADEMELFQADQFGPEDGGLGAEADPDFGDGAVLVHRAAMNEDLAVVWLEKAAHHVDGGGFAGAAGA